MPPVIAGFPGYIRTAARSSSYILELRDEVLLGSITLFPVMVRSIAGFSVCVCLYICVSVCSRISNTTCPKFHEIFYACYLWPWLDFVMTTMQYVMYFRFYV